MTARSILLVSHCWRYNRLLAYQLSSLILHPPKCRVRMIIYFSGDDKPTVDVIMKYGGRANAGTGDVSISGSVMEEGRLFRRAIGRDVASKACEEDLCWYTDCDQAFGPGCLDAVCENFDEEKGLCYPADVAKCSQEYGDELIEAVKPDSGLLRLDPEKFTPKKYPRAIGGVQIVTGETAREVGYCRKIRRFQRPAERWMKTADDVTARKIWGFGRGYRIDVPNLLRIRHTKYGRTHVGIRN